MEATEVSISGLEPPDNRLEAATDAVGRWQCRARDGLWMVAVYRCCGRITADVMCIDRTHLNEQSKLRIAGVVQRVSSAGSCLIAAEVIDLPVDKLQWYEIMEPLASHEVSKFQIALAKGMALCELLEDREAITSADVARRNPR